MHCDDAEKAIVEQGTEVSDTVREHLAACPRCQQFARLQQALLAAAPGPGPGPELEARVLAAAHGRLRPAWRLLPRGGVLALAAAAALVLAGAVWVLLAQRNASPSKAAMVVAAVAAPAVHSWAVAQADLAFIEDELDAAVAELGNLGAPSMATDGFEDSAAPWDALMELEFDVYFESQNLRQAGG